MKFKLSDELSRALEAYQTVEDLAAFDVVDWCHRRGITTAMAINDATQLFRWYLVGCIKGVKLLRHGLEQPSDNK